MSDNSYDVAVIGAGVAGSCAAISSARNGLRTVLIEERKSPGGTVTAGFQRYICGLYANDPADPFRLLNDGISTEIIGLLDDSLPGDNRVKMGKVELHSFDSHHLPKVLTDLIDSEKNLDLKLSTTLTDLDIEDNSITALHLDNGDTIAPSYVIDSSGRGAAIESADAAAGEPAHSEHQLAGFSICISGIKSDDDQLPVKVAYAARKGTESGDIDSRLRVTTFSQGVEKGSGVCRINIARSDIKSGEEFKLAEELHTFLRTNMNEFAYSKITDQSPSLLDRDGLVLAGRQTLRASDILKPVPIDNPAASCAWPIEFWHKDKGPSYKYQEPGSVYQIPEGCLISERISNLYAAGRCISADLEALASCRTAGTCMALGEAAAIMVYRDLSKVRI